MLRIYNVYIMTKYPSVFIIFALSERGFTLYVILGTCFFLGLCFSPPDEGKRGTGAQSPGLVMARGRMGGGEQGGQGALWRRGRGWAQHSGVSGPPDCSPRSTGSEQSLSTRSPASTWACVQQLKVIDSQRELSRLSRELEP